MRIPRTQPASPFGPPCSWTYPEHFGLALQTFLPAVLAGGPRSLCLGHQEATRGEDHEVPTDHVIGQHAAETRKDPGLTPLGLKTADPPQLRPPWGATRNLSVTSWRPGFGESGWDREHLESQRVEIVTVPSAPLGDQNSQTGAQPRAPSGTREPPPPPAPLLHPRHEPRQVPRAGHSACPRRESRSFPALVSDLPRAWPAPWRAPSQPCPASVTLTTESR